jgi:uncharacterized membrane protein (Fun14 family)
VVSELLAKAVSGFIIGYMLGKGVKVLLHILGILLLILVGLEAAGYIHVNWEKLASDVSTLVSSILSPSQGAGQLLDWLNDNWGAVLGFIAGLGLSGGISRRALPLPR